MNKPNIKSTRPVVPMIYAYTTPGVTYHDGYIKIGYTEQDVDKRIKQQTHTAGIRVQKEWQGNAVFEDGSGETFKDTEFHAYMRKNGVEQPMDKGNKHFDAGDRNEWFFISPSESKSMFYEFRSNHGILEAKQAVVSYQLRAEQEEAVSRTAEYFNTHENGEFLWNAKPRFGKTLSMYDLAKRIQAQTILIVTNRPAIANSWYSDYARFIGREAGYFFVSSVDGIQGKQLVITYDAYEKDRKKRESDGSRQMGLIDFVSLQDLKGSIYFGGYYNKLQEIGKINWDLLVIDEIGKQP